MQKVTYPKLQAIVASLYMLSTPMICSGSYSPGNTGCSEQSVFEHMPLSPPCSPAMGSEVDGHVFIMTNSASRWSNDNKVVMYDRDQDGMLTFRNSYATGGKGSGPAPTATVFGPEVPHVSAAHDGLGSQGSLIINSDHTCLVGVNAGSDSVFSFKIEKGKELSLQSTIDSGGIFPNSVTLSKPDAMGLSSLYILNAMGDGSVSRLIMDRNCGLYTNRPDDPYDKCMETTCLKTFTETFPSPKPGEVLTSPAMIAINPDNDKLLVTIKGGVTSGFSGRVVVFDVERGGAIKGCGQATEFNIPSENGVGRRGPFSLDFLGRDLLSITHVYDHSVGMYRLLDDNRLEPVGNAVSTGTKFPCWIKTSLRGVIVGSFGELKPLDMNLEIDGPGIFSTFGVDGSEMIKEGSVFEAARFEDHVNGNHVIDFAVIRSTGDDFLAKEFIYAAQPRTGRIAIMEIKAGRSNASGIMLEQLGTTQVVGAGAGVDPNSTTINHFNKRCGYYSHFGKTPQECKVSSIQGITGF